MKQQKNYFGAATDHCGVMRLNSVWNIGNHGLFRATMWVGQNQAYFTSMSLARDFGL